MSVIMPIRNMADYVDAQLEALSNQTLGGDWELVVADNGSGDRTAERVRAWTDRIPSLRLVDAAGPAEPGYARNVGAAASRGSLLAFCDADDVVTSTWLEDMVRALGSHPLVVGLCEHRALNPPAIADAFDLAHPDPAWGFLPGGSTANLGVRRECFVTVGGFRLGYRGGSEDTDLLWRLQLAGVPHHRTSEVVVHRRLKQRTAWQILRLHVGRGRATVQLYEQFRDAGMPRSPLRDVAYDWFLAPVSLVRRDDGRRLKAARTLGCRIGRLLGSGRDRVWFP